VNSAEHKWTGPAMHDCIIGALETCCRQGCKRTTRRRRCHRRRMNGSGSEGGLRLLAQEMRPVEWLAMRALRLTRGTPSACPSFAQGIRPVEWLAMSEPSARRRRAEGESNGAPSMTRTCDLLVRRAKQGDRTGQQQTAAPVFPNVFCYLSQPGSTPSRHRLSVICQSFFSRLRLTNDGQLDHT
jgi:hypothetical protein